MAGSYIFRNGALAGEAVPRFLFAEGTLATHRAPEGIWGEPDGGEDGSPDARAAAPDWSARISTSGAALASTSFKCLIGNATTGGNTSVAELFVVVTLTEGGENALEIIGKRAPGYSFDDSVGSYLENFSHTLGEPLVIQFQGGDITLKREDGTVLANVPWADASVAMIGTYLGSPVAYNPAFTYPWIFSATTIEGDTESALLDVFYNGIPEGGASVFWTNIVGARETP